MGRPEDIAWKFVIKRGKKWRCPYCEIEYSGSVPRVRSHLLKQRKEGIASCTKVPEHISTLMELSHNQVHNKEDIAWKFVDGQVENRWRCYHCREEFCGDLTVVKGHLLGVPNEGISICTQVPDHIRTLMLSLLDEVGEEQSREAPGQSSMEPQSHDTPTQAEEAERESGEANRQFPTEPQSHVTLPPAATRSSESRELWAPVEANNTSDPQGESPSCSTDAFAEEASDLLASSHQPQCSLQSPYTEEMPTNDQQIPTGASSYQDDQLPSACNSSCSQDCNQHSQLRTPMDMYPPMASQHTTDSHVIEATIDDLQVPMMETITIGQSSQDINGGSPIMNVWMTPQSYGWMEQMLQEDWAVDIANLSLVGATSYPSACPPPNLFVLDSLNELLLPFSNESLPLNAQQNPSAPLPSQNRQLLDNTSPNELQGSVLPGPIALDAQLTDMGTTNTPQHFDQSDQTFHRQCGRGTGLSPPRASMDIGPPIPSQPFNGPLTNQPFNSPPQISEDIINTTGPSTSEGMFGSESMHEVVAHELVMPKGAPAGASSFHYDQLLGVGHSNLDCNQPRISSVTSVTNTVPPSNQPLPSCNEERGIETSSFPLRDSRAICPVTAFRPIRCPHIEATPVNLQVLENGANVAGPSPSQVQPPSVPPQHQGVPHQFMSPQTMNAPQNPTELSSSQKNHIVPCRAQAPMNMGPCIPSSQAPNNAPPPPQIQCCGAGLIGPSSLPELDMNKGAPLKSHTNIDDNFEKSRALKRKIKRLYRRGADIWDELEYAASLSLKKQRMEVKNWLADEEKLRDDFHSVAATSKDCLLPQQQVDILMQEAEDLLEQGKFPKGLFVVRETKINKLLERKLVGEAFQRNTTEILEYLVVNQISRLGIYGMGGVGKTTLMVHIHNRLLEKANHDNVLWITVSQDFNTQKLQDDIWEALGLKKLQEKDVRKRAAMLSNVLTEREKLIIILDDVWERFDFEEVGIPIRVAGLKLVLTTRSLDVCCQMHCQEKIKIEPLSPEEAESLFFEELGSEVVLNLETKTVVKSIVKECAGLPLGVITMAASMRGVTDVFEWKDCLVKLKESDMGQTDMEKKVLMNLKFSYDRLEKCEVQQCFLSCALYPEDELIDKFKLIEFFMDQGLIDGSRLDTREKQYNRGLTILNKLENVCLLEKVHDKLNDKERLKMHDLTRDMALHIMSATSIVKPGKGLMRIPPEECWTEALEKVSLMKNKISEFPLNISPNCPRLSTILLNDSWSKDVVIIPDSFFRQFWGLKFLNLSSCRHLRELPDSISDLVNLRALLLSWCSELRRIPYLGKLTSLRKLDVSGCHSLDALEGLEKLMNLRYLNLTRTCIERLPKGILNRLPNLQLLEVPAVIEEDVAKLVALETFKCYLQNLDDFNKCVRFIEQSDNPRYYNLTYGPDDTLRYRSSEKSEFIVEVSDDARFGDRRSVSIYGWGHAIVSVGGECAGIFILVPRDVQDLWIENWDGITSLSGMGPLEHLEELFINQSESLGVLGGGKDDEVIGIRDSPAPTPTPILFPSLRVLSIDFCPKLKYLFGHGSISNFPHLQRIDIRVCKEMVGIIAAVTSPPPHPLPAFPSLEEISFECCHKMKRAVEFEWMPHFPNLRRIDVALCDKMEEIIGGPPSHASVEKISLESLCASHCKNMRKLFPHELLLHLRNLQEIWVSECRGMVEMISGAGQGQEGSIMTPVNNTPPSFQPPSISLPNLKKLNLDDLPQLKSICRVPISCDSIKKLRVYRCPELKAIPLELRLRDIDIEELPYIWVEDEEKWKTLMWDDPNAQAILQPYLRKGENARDGSRRQEFERDPNANIESAFPWKRRRTPNAIELDTEEDKSQPWRRGTSYEMMIY